MSQTVGMQQQEIVLQQRSQNAPGSPKNSLIIDYQGLTCSPLNSCSERYRNDITTMERLVACFNINYDNVTFFSFKFSFSSTGG